MRRRILSMMMAVILLFSTGVLPVSATEGTVSGNDIQMEESATKDTVSGNIGQAEWKNGSGTILYSPETDLPGNEELFAGYVEQQFYGNSIALFGTAARNRLNAAEKDIYDFLKTNIETVAKSGGSTEFEVAEVSELSNLQISWTNTDLDVASITDDNVGDVVKTAFAAQYDWGKILDALLSDCPYDLYWFDKTVGGGVSYGYNYNTTKVTITKLTFTFNVVPAYRQENNAYTVTPEVASVSTAVNNAKAVVDANAGKSDYEKLVAYKEYICNSVNYNDEAADDKYTGGYGDPWQLIYVFDGNDSTKVVCEGYAKAFMYLCDLTEWNDNSIWCTTATGYMQGGTGAGDHMWNIVTIGENHYMVDVTNSDEGSIGSGGGLFLVGSGETITGEFTLTGQNGTEKITRSGYQFRVSNKDINYYYDEDTTGLWGWDNDSILKLAGSNCVAYTVIVENGTLTGGTNNVATRGTYFADSIISIKANEPESGKAFANWTATGNGVPFTDSTSETTTFTMPSNEVTVTANYKDVVQAKENSWTTPLSIEGWTYGNTPSTPTAAAESGGEVVFTYSNAENGEYTSEVPTNEGIWYVKATVEATEEYKGLTATKEFTISQKELTADMVRVSASVTYNGSAQNPTVTVNDSAVTERALVQDNDYTITWNKNDFVNADTYTATITGKGNYNGTVTKDFTIAKAEAQTFADELAVTNGRAYDYSIDLSKYNPTGTNVSWGDNISYILGAVNFTVAGYYENGAKIDGTSLSLPIKAVESNEVGTIGTITVTIASQNYADSTLTITVKSANKNDVSDSIELSVADIVYGNEPAPQYSFTGTQDTNPLWTLTYSKDSGANYSTLDSLKNGGYLPVGNYVIKAHYEDSTQIGEQTFNFAVSIADPTCTVPAGLTATYGQTLNEVTLTGAEGDTPGMWSWDDGVDTSVGNAGTQKFNATFTPDDTDNYNTKKVKLTVTVKRASLTVKDVTAESKVYDGNAKVKITDVTLDGIQDSDDVSVNLNGITGTLSGVNVGNYDQVTLPALALVGNAANNYELILPAVPVATTNTVTINKAAVTPLPATVSAKVLYNNTSISVPAIAAGMPADAGVLTFDTSATPVSTGSVQLANWSVGADGTLTADITGGAENDTLTFTVKITSTNYTDTEVTVNVTLVDKQVVTISGASAATGLTYDGTAKAGYNGTPTGNAGYKGTFETVYSGTKADGSAYNAATAPTDAGSYTLIFKIPESNNTHMGSSAPIAFTIAPKQLTWNTEGVTMAAQAYVPGKVEADDWTAVDRVKLAGVVYGDSVSWTGTVKSALFADDMPGTNLKVTVTVADVTLNGTDKTNYLAPTGTFTLLGSITAPVNTNGDETLNILEEGLVVSKENLPTDEQMDEVYGTTVAATLRTKFGNTNVMAAIKTKLEETARAAADKNANNLQSNVLEIFLEYWDGAEWVRITEENVEEAKELMPDGVPVTIPYSAFSSTINSSNYQKYNFSLYHMITLPLDGVEIGDIEQLVVTADEKGLHATVKNGFSPFAISVEEKITDTDSDDDDNDDNDDADSDVEISDTKATNTAALDTVPKTGDEAHVAVPMLLIMLSIGLLALSGKRKAKKNG